MIGINTFSYFITNLVSVPSVLLIIMLLLQMLMLKGSFSVYIERAHFEVKANVAQ